MAIMGLCGSHCSIRKIIDKRSNSIVCAGSSNFSFSHSVAFALISDYQSMWNEMKCWLMMADRSSVFPKRICINGRRSSACMILIVRFLVSKMQFTLCQLIVLFIRSAKTEYGIPPELHIGFRNHIAIFFLSHSSEKKREKETYPKPRTSNGWKTMS